MSDGASVHMTNTETHTVLFCSQFTILAVKISRRHTYATRTGFEISQIAKKTGIYYMAAMLAKKEIDSAMNAWQMILKLTLNCAVLD